MVDWFDSDTEYVAAAASFNYFDQDKVYVPYLEKTLVQAVRFNLDIMEEIRLSELNSPTVSLERYYKKGETGQYLFGNPTVFIDHTWRGGANLDAIIASEYPSLSSTQIDNFYLNRINDELWALAHLAKTYDDFDFQSQTFFIDGTEYTYSNTTRPVDQEGILRINYVNGPLAYYDSIGVPNIIDPFYIIIFTYVSAPSNKQMLWLYDPADGRYALSPNKLVQGTSALPIIRLKNGDGYVGDLASETDEFNAKEEASARNMLRAVGVNFNAIMDGIKSNPEDSNVVHSLFLFAVSINTSSSAGKEYLFRFGQKMLNIQDNIISVTASLGTEQEYLDELNTNFWPSQRIGYSIKEIDSGYDYLLHFNRIEHTPLVVGSIGPIGTYETVLVTADCPFIDVRGILDNNPRPSLSLRKQVTLTEYEEIVLVDLKYKIVVRTKHKAHHLKGELPSGSFPVNPYELFTLPLEIELLQEMSTKGMQEQLAYESARILVTAEESYEVEWYETGAFKIILTIIIVIVTVLTRNPQGLSWLQLLWQVGKQILINYLVGQALEAALKRTDNKYARAILIAAAAYTSFSLAGGNSSNLLTASGLLRIVDASASVYTDWESQDLLVDAANLLRSQEEQRDILEKASELLGSNESDVNYLLDMYTNINTNFYENPVDYFARTLDTNPGIHSFVYAETYHANALMLPSLQPMLDDPGANLFFET